MSRTGGAQAHIGEVVSGVRCNLVQVLPDALSFTLEGQVLPRGPAARQVATLIHLVHRLEEPPSIKPLPCALPSQQLALAC